MIEFGSGWSWQDGRLDHSCEPGLVRQWRGEGGERTCECGAPIPLHAESFQGWVRRELERAVLDRDLRSLFESLGLPEHAQPAEPAEPAPPAPRLRD
jgi:hypothetical protein